MVTGKVTMSSNIRIHRIFVSLMALTSTGAVLAAGPNGTLYAINYFEFGSTSGLDRIQGGSVLSGSTGNPYDLGIAVAGDVRTIGFYNGYYGSRMDLNGNPLVGGPYTPAANTNTYYDGTSDGKYNYAVDFNLGQVFQYDRDWLNPVALFYVTTPYDVGITMNAADGSFWTSQYSTGVVEHFSHSGVFLDSFSTGMGAYVLSGLAYDPSDGTLWAGRFDNGHNLFQYDLSGNLLQVSSYTLDGYNFYGMEFNQGAVPEPASMATLAIGALALVRRKARK